MTEKVYVLTIISDGKYGKQAAEINLATAEQAIEIMSLICDHALNAVDFKFKAVTPERMVELSGDAPDDMTDGEAGIMLGDIYSNVE